MFYRLGVHKKIHKIHRKILVTESLFDRVAVLIPATLLKKRSRQIDFPVNFVQLKKMLFTEHLWMAASTPCIKTL